MDFIRDSLRPPLVVFGNNPAFGALLKATHIKQLLLLDHFGEGLDVLDLTNAFEAMVARWLSAYHVL